MKAYILIETLMGKAGIVTNGIRDLQFTEAQTLSVDAVTGPFDVVVIVETTDLETLIRSVTDRIQEIDGVQRTITCVA
jgi:DNA-binding Lrp family transcriptional regulator